MLLIQFVYWSGKKEYVKKMVDGRMRDLDMYV